MKSTFFNLSSHQKVFAIALPMMISNISIPLLGLVDTAVIGHMPESHYLAGVAVGSMVVTLIFWMLSFLRMSTTGLVAQAYGSEDHQQIFRLLLQAIFIALILSIIILALQKPFAMLAFEFVDGSEQVLFYAQQYFSIRIWSAPAALINMALLGWLLGMQNAKVPMFLLIISNLINIILDVLFVVAFDWGVAGVAWASLISDYIALAFGLFLVKKIIFPFYRKGDLLKYTKQLTDFNLIKKFVLLNRDIFIRTLCIQIAFAFMTIQGVKLGDDIVAANSVLMHFLLLISFSMDGLAYAAEALVGKSIGSKCLQKLKQSIYVTFFWSAVFSLLQLCLFYMYGEWIIRQLTSIENVQYEAVKYLPWLIIIPITSMLGFIFDGIFIGMTRAKEMRNSLLFSLLVVYFPVWFLFAGQGNHALWLAMNAFMLVRGLSLLWIYIQLNRNNELMP